MDEKTATYIQCAGVGLGFALSVLAFAYACWSIQREKEKKKLLPPINVPPPTYVKLEDNENGERKIDPKFIKAVCTGLERN